MELPPFLKQLQPFNPSFPKLRSLPLRENVSIFNGSHSNLINNQYRERERGEPAGKSRRGASETLWTPKNERGRWGCRGTDKNKCRGWGKVGEGTSPKE
ncbi:hypothetical protein CEXT_157161 [Caerostris extrusa]|uniref:Uncharacterized protein n=1 Tax=Caerostris extrusa TaxID=172846 RepID=A0AAV4XYE8_CAEEX|nr:hypothetical protein CEXT_157161 [Caerostris extrusa]